MALSRITADSIADGTVVAADIANGAVTGPKLGATSINANNIVNGTITSDKLASTLSISDNFFANNLTANSSVKLSNGTNHIELTAPASVGSDRVITFPDATTTVVGTNTTQTLTNKTIQGGAITSGTAQASTSGTSIDFTGIPAYVKRITVMFGGVSTNGTSLIQVQLGDSGGVEATGYLGIVNNGNGTVTNNFTAGFLLTTATVAAGVYHGQISLSLLTGDTWSEVSSIGRSDSTSFFEGVGTKTLSATLDRLRITTATGTDTFDAGTINILFE